jgi:putative protease
MIDLTNIGAGDKKSPDKIELIAQFELLLRQKGKDKTDNSNVMSSAQLRAKNSLETLVTNSTNVQYHNGL